MRQDTRESLATILALKAGTRRVLEAHPELRGNKTELARRVGCDRQRVNEWLDDGDTAFFPLAWWRKLATALGPAEFSQVVVDALAADVTMYVPPDVEGDDDLLTEDVEADVARAQAKSTILAAKADGVVTTAERAACMAAQERSRRESAEADSAWTQAYEAAAL